MTPTKSQETFAHTYNWVFASSIIYELFKTIHIFLFLKVASPQLCGATTTVLSLIYLVMNILDCGATNSIAPFLYLFKGHRRPLKQFLVKYYIYMVVPIIILGSLVATFIIKRSFVFSPHAALIASIIGIETIRSFLRMFLHLVLHTKRVVIIEVASFSLYIGLVWLPFLCFPSFTPTINWLFLPHLIDSIVTISCFLVFTFLYYKKCVAGGQILPSSFHKQLFISRIFNLLLRVSRNMFATGNLLTPIFAYKFGIASAGIFYVASTFATAVGSIVKCIVYYAGNGFLANIRMDTLVAKRDAFKTISRKVVSFIFPIMAIIGVNYSNFALLAGSHTMSGNLFAFSLIFSFIVFFEFFFLLYEQFYILEEVAYNFFIFKAIEMVLFYGLTRTISSPLSLLIGVIGIKLFSFILVAANAYFIWKIRLSLRMKPLFFTGCVVLAGGSFIIVRHMIGIWR